MSRFTRWRARQRAKDNIGVFRKLGEVKKEHSDGVFSTLRDKGGVSYKSVSLYIAPVPEDIKKYHKKSKP